MGDDIGQPVSGSCLCLINSSCGAAGDNFSTVVSRAVHLQVPARSQLVLQACLCPHVSLALRPQGRLLHIRGGDQECSLSRAVAWLTVCIGPYDRNLSSDLLLPWRHSHAERGPRHV